MITIAAFMCGGLLGSVLAWLLLKWITLSSWVALIGELPPGSRDAIRAEWIEAGAWDDALARIWDRLQESHAS